MQNRSKNPSLIKATSALNVKPSARSLFFRVTVLPFLKFFANWLTKETISLDIQLCMPHLCRFCNHKNPRTNTVRSPLNKPPLYYIISRAENIEFQGEITVYLHARELYDNNKQFLIKKYPSSLFNNEVGCFYLIAGDTRNKTIKHIHWLFPEE